ncbi:MAG: hypothetical protein ACKVOR_00665 [Flavobacteriales bacterium]
MKNLFMIAVLMVLFSLNFSIQTHAQNESNNVTPLFTGTLAIYKHGGEAGLVKFISDNFKWPDIIPDSLVGKVIYYTVMIESDGSVSSITLDKHVSQYLDAEGLRVLWLTANSWLPARDNKASVVRCIKRIPIPIRK